VQGFWKFEFAINSSSLFGDDNDRRRSMAIIGGDQ
jgi:hypothetical protein